MDQHHRIPHSQALANIHRDRRELAKDIPPGHKKAFIAAIKKAVEFYFTLPHLGSISTEFQSLAKATRRGGTGVGDAIEGLSEKARERLAEFGPVPTAKSLRDLRTRQDEVERLRQLLIRGGQWVQQKSQRRWVEPVLAIQKKGRPKDRPELVLVSFLAVPYAKATGKPTTRSWSIDPKSEDDLSMFERIVKGVLVALKIHDRHDAKNLVEKHVRAVKGR